MIEKHREAIKKYWLGSAVKITTLLNINTATCTITIDNPAETEMVSSAAMTKEGDKVYSYIFQSLSTYVEGIYLATITVVSGSYTCVEQITIEFKEQE